jgi:hypothetical protein
MIQYDTYILSDLIASYPDVSIDGVPEIRTRSDGDSILLGVTARFPYGSESHFTNPNTYCYCPRREQSAILMQKKTRLRTAFSEGPVNLIVTPTDGTNINVGLCVGVVTLGAITYTDVGLMTIHLALREKLPRNVWFAVGGWDGWLVYVNGGPYCTINTYSGQMNFLAIGKDSIQIEADNYEGDHIYLVADESHACILFEASDASEYCLQPAKLMADGDPESVYTFFEDSSPIEISLSKIVSRTQAFDCLASLLSGLVPLYMIRCGRDDAGNGAGVSS